MYILIAKSIFFYHSSLFLLDRVAEITNLGIGGEGVGVDGSDRSRLLLI
jgi:hypothetical protein